MTSIKGYGQKYLFSPRAALFTLILFLFFCLIGVLIPQKGGLGQGEWKAAFEWLHTLQLTSIYSSIWFLLATLFLVIILSHTLYHQLRKILGYKERVRKRGYAKLNSSSLPVFTLGTVPVALIIPKMKKLWQAYGYKILSIKSTKEEQFLFFTRNRFGIWGSWVFHLGLLVIILGAIWSFTLRKRGFQQIIQNELFSTKQQEWLTKTFGILAKDFDLDFQMKVNHFQPVYRENDKVKDLSNKITVIDHQGETYNYDLAIGRPISFEGTKIYQTFDYGYSLGFTLFDQDGKEQSLTNFCLDAPSRKEIPFQGEAEFPETEYRLKMEFHPDLLKASRKADCPGIDLMVTKNEQPLFKGMVLFSQGVNLGKDRLVFSSINYWTGLVFVKNQGVKLVMIGFILSILGACALYFFPAEEGYIKLWQKDNQWDFTLAGWTKRYKALMEQKLQNVTQDIQNSF